MGRTFSMTIYCGNVKGCRYRAIFEEQKPGEWYGIKSERLKPLSFLEKKALQSQFSPKTSKFFTPVLGKYNPDNQPAPTVNGSFYSGVLKCPDCGNTQYVKCNICHQLTCYDRSGHFTCAVCGNSGKVSGYINSLSGTANNTHETNNSKNNNSKYNAKKF